MISFRNAQEEQEEEEAEEVCSYLQLLYKQNDGTSMRACLIVEKATSICAMATVVAVPGRNQTLFRCIFPPCYCVQSTVA